jgi:hypothetical protein
VISASLRRSPPMTAIHGLCARRANVDILQTDEAVKCCESDALRQTDHDM